MKTIFTSLIHPQGQPSNKKIFLVLAIFTLASTGIYLVACTLYYRTGFPLDDSWIHQTFARNLALNGEWAFYPGTPSNASTSPLWSALLAVGYGLKLMPYVWTYFLGMISLWAVSSFAEITSRQLMAEYHPRFPWIGIAILFEWHLVWAAVSGMETLLFTFLVTIVLLNLLAKSQRYLLLGMLTGISVWIRPEGITLLGPICFVLVVTKRSKGELLKHLLNLLLGFGILFVLYLFFNLVLSGSPWPNTFYAKQAEFASYSQTPFFIRWGKVAFQPLIGIGLICLPGMVIYILHITRLGDFKIFGVLCWILGFLAIYAWKLPVTYQYGRYVMPLIPIICILGLLGLFEIRYDFQKKNRWMVMTFWKTVLATALIIFWGLGATAYSKDVAYIESEMVDTARWVSDNLQHGALIATHDIGALGYFGNHKLLDLAGLVSPQVIPIIQNINELSDYMNKENVDYLVTFPDWYPELTDKLPEVFTTNGIFTSKMGGTNMVVYKWVNPLNP